MKASAPNNFDAIRLAMSVAVIYAHAYPLSSTTEHESLDRVSVGQAGAGNLAVCVFFAISGYLVSMSWSRASSMTSFLTRRIRRLYPGFIVATTFAAFAVTPIALDQATDLLKHDGVEQWALACVTLHLWRWPGAFSTNAFPEHVNGSVWTIQYELACYLLLTLVGMLRLLRRPSTVACVALLLYALHVCHAEGIVTVPDLQWPDGGLGAEPGLLWASLFFAGSVAWAYADRIRYRWSYAIGCAVALGFSFRLPAVSGFACVAPIALPYLIFAIAFAPISMLANFAQRVGGDYSYGVYLYAFPIQQLVTMSFGGRMIPLVNLAISLPLALLFGIASWHLVEKRFLRRDRSERRATIVPPEAVASSQ